MPRATIVSEVGDSPLGLHGACARLPARVAQIVVPAGLVLDRRQSDATVRIQEGSSAGHRRCPGTGSDDFNLGRIQLREPTPIPEDEARWAWDWMASWGLIHGTFDVTTQINRKVEREAHELVFALSR